MRSSDEKPTDSEAPEESPAEDAERPSQAEPAESPHPRFPVVAIGASAGGLDALVTLVSALRPRGAAYVIVQHLSPLYPSSLTEILSRSAKLPVVGMQPGLTIQPDTIYTAPPGVEVRLEGGALQLRALKEGAHDYHRIDTLFRSVARERGAGAIAVVLSGAGSDGSLGIRAVKDEGGITFVQDPASASHSGMPQSALETGCVDFCLSPGAIGEELMRVGSHPYVVHPRPPRRFGPELLAELFDQLLRVWGVDFSSYKLSTVERRIERRMALQQVQSPSDYLKLVEEHRPELNALYDDLLIGVTSFFRDQEPFEVLKTSVFPMWLDKRSPELPVRVWVPGCATGEEAYSIVICLLEVIEDQYPGHRLQVFATDIDERALSHARQGAYPQGIELDVSSARLQRFFTRSEKGGYQVSRKLRDMVVFARHNLGKDPPFSRLDLVSCRNVLIYLQPALQRRVMRVFHYALNPRGCLLLGTAESVGDASDLFSLVERKLKLYTKKNVAAMGVFDFAYGARGDGSLADMSSPPTERKPEISLQQLADRKILDKYAPPGILVDEELNILQFRGHIGPFLAPSPGAATFNVMRMIRPELLAPLKGALNRVMHEGTPVSCEPVRLPEAGQPQIGMDVIPLDAASYPRCMLVLFRQVAPAEPRAAGGDEAAPAGSQAPDPKRVQELERELISTKDYLETIIQELATANEELQSSNEELQSSNEELQSTNEELETSKEELQATNEELVTVNEELQMRVTQLGVTNDDLTNVLINVSAPVVLVGLDLRIRRFSAAAERLLNLISSDVGRPISYLGTMLNVPQIEATMSESINTMSAREIRVRCANGGWYVLRSAPYQTADRAIRGVVIELTPVPPPQSAGQVMQLDELAGKVLATLPHELAVVDQSLRVVWINEAFQVHWGVNIDVQGEPLELLVPRRAPFDGLWSAVENAVFGGRAFASLKTPPPDGDDGAHSLTWSARCLPEDSGRGALTMLVIERAH